MSRFVEELRKTLLQSFERAIARSSVAVDGTFPVTVRAEVIYSSDTGEVRSVCNVMVGLPLVPFTEPT